MRRVLVGCDEVGEASENGLWRWTRASRCLDLARDGSGLKRRQSRLVGMTARVGMSEGGGGGGSQKEEEASGEEEERERKEGGGRGGAESSSMLLPADGRRHRSFLLEDVVTRKMGILRPRVSKSRPRLLPEGTKKTEEGESRSLEKEGSLPSRTR